MRSPLEQRASLALYGDMASGYSIFISYNHEDSAAARAMRDYLLRCGHEVFHDDALAGGPSEILAKVITERMLASNMVLLLVGPAGPGGWQWMEIGVAIEDAFRRERRVLPIFLPGVTAKTAPPSVAMVKQLPGVELADLGETALDELHTRLFGHAPPKAAAAPPPPVAQGPLEEAVRRLCVTAAQRPISFYLGERVLHEGGRFRPNSHELARSLFRDIHLIQDDYRDFLPTADVAGLFYDLDQSEPREPLENRVTSLWSGEVGDVPPTHRQLAGILGHLRDRASWRGARAADAPLPPQLVLTTNLDLWMERALLRERVPFTRIVQLNAPGSEEAEWQVTELTLDFIASLPARPAPPEPLQVLDGYLARAESRVFQLLDKLRDRQNRTSVLGIEKLTGPILYKYHGSQDVPSSCTISTDHYIEAAGRTAVPNEIRTMISDTPSVFLGYRLLDPPFRHVFRTLLWRPFVQSRGTRDRYLISAPPSREEVDAAAGDAKKAGAGDPYLRMEAKNWEITTGAAPNLGFRVVDEWPAEFLKALRRCL